MKRLARGAGSKPCTMVKGERPVEEEEAVFTAYWQVGRRSHQEEGESSQRTRKICPTVLFVTSARPCVCGCADVDILSRKPSDASKAFEGGGELRVAVADDRCGHAKSGYNVAEEGGGEVDGGGSRREGNQDDHFRDVVGDGENRVDCVTTELDRRSATMKSMPTIDHGVAGVSKACTRPSGACVDDLFRPQASHPRTESSTSRTTVAHQNERRVHSSVLRTPKCPIIR